MENDDSTAFQDNGDDEPDDAAERARLIELYDLDGDGKVSMVESWRSTLGLIDARMQTLAQRDGVLVKLATSAHRLLDRYDNDENPPGPDK